MKGIGLLTEKNELVSSVLENSDIKEIVRFRSSDSVRPDDIFILLVDSESFDENENAQFFLSKIRKKLLDIPVLMIIDTTKKENLNMEWFFDDFILHPFRKGELPLRIKKFIIKDSLLEEEETLEIGNVKLNLKEYSVYHNNEKLDFTFKEFELLRHLIKNKDQVFSRKDLLAKIWGIEYIGGTRTVDVHIRRLRSKLGEDFNSIIETVRNVGYKCVDPDSAQNSNKSEL